MQSDVKLQLVDDTPDRLVSDFRMPGMNRRQFAGKLNSREHTSGLSVALLAAKAGIFEKLSGDAAASQVMGWEGGNFQINFEASTRHETTTLNPRGLMEGLRLVGKVRRDPGGKSEEEADVLLDS